MSANVPRADLRLDPLSSLPLHAQAEQRVRELIERPEYSAGGLLPDEVSLSRSLGISRNTLRAAIGRCAGRAAGAQGGGGHRVVEPRCIPALAPGSFTREMAARASSGHPLNECEPATGAGGSRPYPQIPSEPTFSGWIVCAVGPQAEFTFVRIFIPASV
jgi:hypothetical protein